MGGMTPHLAPHHITSPGLAALINLGNEGPDRFGNPGASSFAGPHSEAQSVYFSSMSIYTTCLVPRHVEVFVELPENAERQTENERGSGTIPEIHAKPFRCYLAGDFSGLT